VVMAPSTRMTRIYRRERLVVDVEEVGLPLEVGADGGKCICREGKTMRARDCRVL
jgi:hypothetical protein